jgi:hypothetical protein
MFNAFLDGQVDITDWPLGNGDISSMCAIPNFFCTSPTSELAIFHSKRTEQHQHPRSSCLQLRAPVAQQVSAN